MQFLEKQEQNVTELLIDEKEKTTATMIGVVIRLEKRHNWSKFVISVRTAFR